MSFVFRIESEKIASIKMIYKQNSLQLISSRRNLIINTKLGNLLNRRNTTLLNKVKYVVFSFELVNKNNHSTS